MPTTIRPMTPDDVGPAAASVLRGDWGNRGPFFAWAARHPQARPFVAESGGAVVGTAVGTVSGRVGWVGAVFVDGDRRGQGLGRGLTDAVVDALEAAGCRTLLLVATQAGRPIYERMGFRPDTTYHTIEAPGTGAAGAPTPSAATLERWSPTDLDAMARLDRLVTGEDRRHLLEAFSSPVSYTHLTLPTTERV